MTSERQKNHNAMQKYGSKADLLERFFEPLNPFTSEREKAGFQNGVENPEPRSSWWTSDEPNDEKKHERDADSEEEPSETDEDYDYYDEDDDDDYDDDDDDDSYQESQAAIELAPEPEPYLEIVRQSPFVRRGYTFSSTRTTLKFYNENDAAFYTRCMREIDPDYSLDDCDENSDDGVAEIIEDIESGSILRLLLGVCKLLSIPEAEDANN